MIDLTIKVNLFAPLVHACPDCFVQPAQDCFGVPHTASERPIYHRARVELAFARGMESWEASKKLRATARRG
jgi:hypothetical protein